MNISPRTQDLPELRRTGDLYMFVAACIGYAGCLWVGWQFNQFALAATLGTVLMVVAAGLTSLARGSWFNSVALPLVVSAQVILQINASGGTTQYHFGVFVTLAFMLAYRHWLPLVVTAATFAVHHVVFDRLQAFGFPVYCLTKPDLMVVAEHASYVVAQTALSLLIAAQMRKASYLAAELDAVTATLSRTAGKVDFTGLSGEVRTEAGAQLLRVLQTIRDATQVAQRTADGVNHAAAEIASGNQDLSHRTEQTAAELQRTAAALEQLTASVRSSSDTVQTANRSAEAAVAKAADREGAAAQLTTSLAQLAESSRRVADITSVIDGIAFQTNILALNAAVEAARAGEAGRGFAVVAQEVRALAQRSAEAARQIKQLIGQSNEYVDEGVSVGQQTRDALAQIVQEVRQVGALLAEVAGSAGQQTSGIAHVSQAVSALDQATQQNAALVEQSAAAAEALKSQAQRLAQAMHSFETGAAVA